MNIETTGKCKIKDKEKSIQYIIKDIKWSMTEREIKTYKTSVPLRIKVRKFGKYKYVL